MIRINSSENIERIIIEIEKREKRIEEIFNETNANMETINDTEIWTGLAQKEFSRKYGQLASNYEAIQESIKTYVKVIRQAVEDYKEMDLQRSKDVETNNVTLDVNS